jgi:hypothetical protein
MRMRKNQTRTYLPKQSRAEKAAVEIKQTLFILTKFSSEKLLGIRDAQSRHGVKLKQN